MNGVINVGAPFDIFNKLEYEAEKFKNNRNDTYAAINALRDAFHLREWIWHAHLENNMSLQQAVMQSSGDEAVWNRYINTRFTNFMLIREICNGSKHFTLDNGGLVAGYEQSTLSGGARLSDNMRTSDASFYARDSHGVAHSIHEMVDDVRAFWARFFQTFPQLK